MHYIDRFYLDHEEPVKGCLLALKEIILQQDEQLEASWKYGMPFFCYRGKMCFYLWVHKKWKQPYIGFIEGNRLEHPQLLAEKRSRIKILCFDPNEDLPVELIELMVQQALDLYRNGVIRIK